MFFSDQVRDQVNTRRCPGKLPGKRQVGSRSAKIECKSQVKILNVKKLNAKLNGLISANLMSICQVVHLYYTSSVQMLTPCFQFECLSWVAYLRLPLPESRHSHVLANLKSYVLSVIVLFSKPH